MSRVRITQAMCFQKKSVTIGGQRCIMYCACLGVVGMCRSGARKFVSSYKARFQIERLEASYRYVRIKRHQYFFNGQKWAGGDSY